MKRSNVHEVTLRAVLGMLFTYLCPQLVRRQMLKTPRASCVCVCVVKTARLCHSHIQREAEHAEFIFK